MDVVDRVYDLTRSFPKEELYGLTNQIRRSAVSIPLNIAEGQGRSAPKEFSRNLRISLGSLSELDTQIEIALRQSYIEPTEAESLFELLLEVRKILFGLIKSLNREE